MQLFRLYSPLRFWRVYGVLLTLYLLIRKKERFLLLSPLSPERLLSSITELGASFIKLAQVLATRNDFFPPPYLDKLKTLHDELPPMKPDVMQKVFDRAFEHDPFYRFEKEPLASASIGQVHDAWLDKDTKVAVKLRREGIERRVKADIRILSFFNVLFRPLFSHHTKHSIEAVIKEFSSMILKEVSMTQERANLEKFSETYAGNLLVSKEGKLILLDFGMVKRVPNDMRVAIIELIKAANEQDYERYVSASKHMGTVAYDAPTAELAEFTERMFEIFNNDALDSSSMQDLAFEVLDQTRNLPFKLPQEAIYILRVSAIIEGLGTTYIENFNGIKDILPILQKNIPRALGAKESIVETIYDEFKNLPLDVRAFHNALYRISEENLTVELSKAQLEVLEVSLKRRLRPVILGMILMISGIFALLYDQALREAALILFSTGVLSILYTKG